MIPSTKVVPMSLLKNKTKEVDCSSRQQKYYSSTTGVQQKYYSSTTGVQQKYNSSTTGVLQKLTLVLLMFMATGCVSRTSDAEYCTDMRVVPTHEFNCTYMNPWSMICSRKRVYKPICARWA